MTVLNEVMAHVRHRLAAAGIDDPMAEARILVGGLLGYSRTDFIIRGEDHVAPDEEARVHEAVGRRVGGEPPYRILGRRGFYGLDLILSEDTLEPRPDTEVLVDLVLDVLKGRADAPLRILDLGTGTGAICLALLSGLPNARGMGSDLAPGALRAAEQNAVLNGLTDRFSTVRSHWFDEISGQYDVIVSNPPYIRSGMIPTLDREVRDHDPLLALDGGPDGLHAYRMIAAGAGAFLASDGIVAVETGFDQKAAVREIFARAGFEQIAAARDLAGNDRAQVFRVRK